MPHLSLQVCPKGARSRPYPVCRKRKTRCKRVFLFGFRAQTTRSEPGRFLRFLACGQKRLCAALATDGERGDASLGKSILPLTAHQGGLFPSFPNRTRCAGVRFGFGSGLEKNRVQPFLLLLGGIHFCAHRKDLTCLLSPKLLIKSKQCERYRHIKNGLKGQPDISQWFSL